MGIYGSFSAYFRIMGEGQTEHHRQTHFITLNYTKFLFWIISNSIYSCSTYYYIYIPLKRYRVLYIIVLYCYIMRYSAIMLWYTMIICFNAFIWDYTDIQSYYIMRYCRTMILYYYMRMWCDTVILCADTFKRLFAAVRKR